MNMTLFVDVVSAIFLLIGAFLSLVAAIGLLRFPDLLTRMHAATKPQILGLLLILLGVGLQLGELRHAGMLILIAICQLLTAPVAAHMVGRAAYRTGGLRKDLLITDELSSRISQKPDD